MAWKSWSANAPIICSFNSCLQMCLLRRCKIWKQGSTCTWLCLARKKKRGPRHCLPSWPHLRQMLYLTELSYNAFGELTKTIESPGGLQDHSTSCWALLCFIGASPGSKAARRVATCPITRVDRAQSLSCRSILTRVHWALSTTSYRQLCRP